MLFFCPDSYYNRKQHIRRCAVFLLIFVFRGVCPKVKGHLMKISIAKLCDVSDYLYRIDNLFVALYYITVNSV